MILMVVLVQQRKKLVLILVKQRQNFAWVCIVMVINLLVYEFRIKYLVLFRPEKCDAIYNRIRYLISEKSGITYVIYQNYAIFKVDSYDSLRLEKTLTFRNVILIKSVFNKDQSNYYRNILLEKFSYQLAKKQWQNFFW